MKRNNKNIMFRATSIIAKICLAAVIISLASCKGFLDEKLYNKYPTKDYFSSVKRLDMGVLAVYRGLQMRETYGQAMLAYDNDTDISHINGSTTNSGNEWRDIAHYYVHKDISWIDNTWCAFYNSINDANLILENYPNVPATTEAEQKAVKKLVAETKFLRAIMYFDLVKLYGDVPLKLNSSKPKEHFKTPRIPKAQVYTQIVKDIEEAIPDLPWHDDANFTKDTRVSKGAAMGMLARIQLYRGGYSLDMDGTRKRPDNYKEYYQAVLDITKELIESGKHSLNPSYEKIFKNMCEQVLEPRECMFEIDLFFNQGYSDLMGYVGSWNAIETAKGVYSRANAFVRTHWMMYNKYESTDLRKDVAIGTYKVNDQGERKPIAVKDSQTWGVGKWRREWQDIILQHRDQNNTNVNYVLLRYSDILLMRAEALNEINSSPTPEARELVNMIRRRGYGKPIEVADPSVDMKDNEGTNQADFLIYLQEERARELCFEGLTRRMDLIRWNILGKKIKETDEFCKNNPDKISLDFTAGQLFRENKNELYPIPAREMRENPTLEQNPGYSK